MANPHATSVEFLYLKLAPGATIDEPGTPAYQTWTGLVAQLKSAPGARSVFGGRAVEDANTAVFATVFESPEKALTTPKAIYDGLDDLLVHPLPQRYHVTFLPDPVPALTAPVTELVVGYGVEAVFKDQAAQFATTLNTPEAGQRMPGTVPVSATSGETMEDNVIKDSFAGIDGEPGKALVFAAGWESREAHIALKGSQSPIDENIHLLRTGRKDMGMIHVSFKKQ